PRVGLQRQVIVEVLIVADHALGADRYRRQALQHPRSDISEAHDDGPQQPFLSTGAEEVDAAAGQPELEGTDRLDRIHNEQDVAALERRAQGSEVRPKPAPELDGTDGEHARPRIAEAGQRLDIDPSLRGPVEA